MGNTLTNLDNTVISQLAFEAFVAGLLPVSAFSLNASAAPAARGDKVKVLSVGSQDAAADFAGTYTIQDADAEGVDVSLTKHKFVSWALSDTEIANKPQLEVEKFARQKGYQLAKAVMQDVLSVVTNANYGAAGFTGAANTFDADDVVDLRTLASTAGWTDMDRAMVLSPSYLGALLKDDAIQGADKYGSAEAIRNGVVARVSGFNVYESSLVPANSENLVGFVCVPDAILVANRYLAPQAGHAYANVQAISDPATGLTVGIREWYDNDTGTKKVVMECSYGYLKGNTAALKRLISAAPSP